MAIIVSTNETVLLNFIIDFITDNERFKIILLWVMTEWDLKFWFQLYTLVEEMV